MINRLRIVFVAESPGERPAKFAYGLRCNGFSCLLIHIADLNFNPSIYFDYSIRCHSPMECVEIAKRLDPDIIHIFSFHADETALAISRNLSCKIVYDYKDIFENMIIHPADPLLWKNQRALIERADGLCCRDRQIDHYCQINNVTPRGKHILYLDYCYGINFPLTPKLGGADEVHTICHGSFTPEDVYPQFSCNGLYLITEVLTQQKIHVHIYPGIWVTHALTNKKHSIYNELVRKNPYFHIHSHLTIENLIKEISQYDIGLSLYQGEIFGIPDQYTIDNHQSYVMAARLFDYLEAGLDILVQDNFLTMADVLQQYKFGKTVDCTYIFSDLKDKLLELKHNTMRKEQIAQARIDLSIERHTNKLIDFYNSL